jgi:hypothetical protein
MSQQDNLGPDKDLEMEDDKPDIAVILFKMKFLETLFHQNLRVNITLVLLPDLQQSWKLLFPIMIKYSVNPDGNSAVASWTCSVHKNLFSLLLETSTLMLYFHYFVHSYFVKLHELFVSQGCEALRTLSEQNENIFEPKILWVMHGLQLA